MKDLVEINSTILTLHCHGQNINYIIITGATKSTKTPRFMFNGGRYKYCTSPNIIIILFVGGENWSPTFRNAGEHGEKNFNFVKLTLIL